MNMYTAGNTCSSARSTMDAMFNSVKVLLRLASCDWKSFCEELQRGHSVVRGNETAEKGGKEGGGGGDGVYRLRVSRYRVHYIEAAKKRRVARTCCNDMHRMSLYACRSRMDLLDKEK